jgi:hypothetical protein
MERKEKISKSQGLKNAISGDSSIIYAVLDVSENI